MKKTNTQDTSWEKASSWYNELVGSEGHYYHQHVIFPKLLKLLKTKKQHLSLLDLGCGQGAFAQVLPKNYSYAGVDLAPSLIKIAKKTNQESADCQFHVHDLCAPFNLEKSFTHATMILSFQNLEHPKIVLENAKKHLKQGGTLMLVINHPCFRIPRQSYWEIDGEKKVQYRRLDSYMTSNKVPIEIHPGRAKKVTTYSFHYPLHEIFELLQEAGFTVSMLYESISDKTSTGKNAKMENRARDEFPLFMTIVAKSL